MLMRLTGGIALIVHGIAALQSWVPLESAILHVFTVAVGILLLAGLWTPIAGVLGAVIALWHGFSQPGDPWSSIMLGTLGAALAMLVMERSAIMCETENFSVHFLRPFLNSFCAHFSIHS